MDLNQCQQNPKTVSLYLTYFIYKRYQNSALLKRSIASIGVVHKMKGHYIDTKHPIIIENLMGIKRKKGINQKGKKPLLINDLKLLINVLHENNQNNIKKLRDKTIMLLGFSGGFRRKN